MPGFNTINVINQLDNLRTSLPNFLGNGVGKIFSAVTASLSRLAILPFRGTFVYDGAPYCFINLASTFIGSMVFHGGYCSYLGDSQEGIGIFENKISAYQMDRFREVSGDCVAQLDPLSYIRPMELQVNNTAQVGAIGFATSTAFALSLKMLAIYSIYNFGQRWPVHYNNILPFYQNGFIDNGLREFSNAYLNHIYTLTKNWCFDNGNQVSAQEADKLYQSFLEFCTVHEGFNTSEINNYDAFLEFLADDDRLDDLSTLEKLGADKSDCTDFKEDKDAVKYACLSDLNFPGRKTLIWQAAKVVSTQYSKQDLIDLDIHQDVIQVVEATRKFARI